MFSKVFGEKPKPIETTKLELLDSYTNYFRPASQGYDDATVRTAIDTIAKHGAKLKMVHIRRQDGKIIKVNDRLNTLLTQRPNEVMSAYDFLYKVVSQLYINNNAFIFVKLDGNANVIGLYPLDYRNVELREATNKEIFCTFEFQSKKITVPYENIIHLRRKFALHSIYGESDEAALNNPLQVLTAARTSIQNAVENSGKIRGYLQSQGVIRDDDLTDILNKFLTRIKSNIASIDSKVSFHQLNDNTKMADNDQLTFAQNEIYNFYGISNKIVSGDFDESDYNAFFESTLEPLAIQMGQEFTQKLFSEKERGYGNEIIFTTNRLEYSSLENKTKMMQVLQQSSILTINEAREIFGFEPIDGGEKLIIKADYAPQDITEEANHNEQ